MRDYARACLDRVAEAERLALLEDDAAAKAELLQLAESWRQAAAAGGSLRDGAAELAKLGFVNERGAAFSSSSIIQ